VHCRPPTGYVMFGSLTIFNYLARHKFSPHISVLLPFLFSFTYAVEFNIMGCGPNHVSEHGQHNMWVHLLLLECHWNSAHLRRRKILQLEGNNNNQDTWRLRCPEWRSVTMRASHQRLGWWCIYEVNPSCIHTEATNLGLWLWPACMHKTTQLI
jgi:hypothetical protein